MPIRRSAAAPPKEDTPPAPAPEPEAKTNSGESTSAEEEQKGAATAANEGEENGDTGEKSGENAPEDGKTGEAGEAAEGEKSGGTEEQGKKKKKKEAAKKAEEKEGGEEKSKKVKRKIPAWATMSASKLACAPKSVSVSQPKVEEILLDAIQNCKERSGASIFTIMKYVMKKYSSMEMDKRTKSQYKRAMKKLVEKGVVKQLKGKGFSGSFTIGKLPSESNSKKKPSISSFAGTKGGTLGEALPLIMTRLCEPKEASYILIKKYLEQHFPQLNVESRPDVLKNCLQRSVEKGFLEQITGKGASGTFQLKKSGNKVLLGGGLLEDAVVAAITAMNEPKCCSISVLRKFLLENHQDKTAYFIVANLKRTLQRCKMMGWMEQITGHGLSGSYQLSYPFYPSPDMLFPEMMEKIKQKEKEKLQLQKRRRDEESDDDDDDDDDEEEEEESEEEESEEEEPPPRKRTQKRPAPRKRQPPPRKKPKTPSRKPAPAKRPAASAKKTSVADNKSATKKIPPPAKATPVKKAAPARKPKTPIAKKMTSRVSKRPTPKKTPAKKQETSSAAESKSVARKSLRARK
ncbi:heterochromatin protein 1-binding protein 3 [Tachysurus vachellii]|uniref:heterochromatin protein 1-binding protein 3 n=1 Tax=Tachysurus vachellii TaxID=175792 RepID=UPI00296AF70F|nr:heterochromatin protein 1-binding protein 3 [Tachysurus vachellii]